MGGKSRTTAMLLAGGIGMLSLGLTGLAPAGASTTAVSPAGTYKAYAVSLGESGLTLTRGGKFTFQGDPSGTWSEVGTKITMKAKSAGRTYVFKITQLGKNLGSKTDEGIFMVNGQPVANWYAIRVTSAGSADPS